jgi:hypothetical protein
MLRTPEADNPPSTHDRASDRGVRAARVSMERRIALVVLGVALVAVLGASIVVATGKSHAAPAGAVASGASASRSLACPFNGCTASRCHPKTKTVRTAVGSTTAASPASVAAVASGE